MSACIMRLVVAARHAARIIFLYVYWVKCRRGKRAYRTSQVRRITRIASGDQRACLRKTTKETGLDRKTICRILNGKKGESSNTSQVGHGTAERISRRDFHKLFTGQTGL